MRANLPPPANSGEGACRRRTVYKAGAEILRLSRKLHLVDIWDPLSVSSFDCDALGRILNFCEGEQTLHLKIVPTSSRRERPVLELQTSVLGTSCT